MMRNLQHYKFLPALACMLFLAACVDDYTDYNSKPLLDGPTLRLSASGASQVILAVPENAYQNSYEAYVSSETPTEFIVSVIDAPGKVGSVSVAPSVPDYGTITLDETSVNALKGKEEGDFRFTFTPNPDLEGDDVSLNLVVTVSDTQLDEDGEDSPITTTLTIPTVVGTPCFSSTIVPGNYIVTEASGNLDGGDTYTLPDLVEAGQSNIVVEIEQERPGVYTFDEVTAGIWPLFYSGRANPALQVDVCGNTITGREGHSTGGAGTPAARTFTLNGTVNADGTISMTWSYQRDDGATPADPAKGSYTLKRIAL